MRLTIALVLSFLAFGISQGCDQRAGSPVPEPVTLQPSGGAPVDAPKALLIWHAGPVYLPIWPIIWYADESAIEIAKSHIIIKPLVADAEIEQVSYEQLSLLLDLARKEAVVQSPPSYSLGTTEFVFVESEAAFERFVFDVDFLRVIRDALDAEIPSDSYFREYLVRVGVSHYKSP
ncbi:MAG: hypothetical protein ACYTEQ_23875 [Planctomycetota bacterium]|jgi:hypothetical protein